MSRKSKKRGLAGANPAVCEKCKGTKVVPVLDVWKMKQLLKSDDFPLIENVPCRLCCEDDFWGFITAKIDRDGEPYTDGKIMFAEFWNTAEHKTFVLLKTDRSDDGLSYF